MLVPFLTFMAAARLIQAANDNTLYNNFGSVVVVRAGERTPITRDGTPVLTALGAQQMYELGQNFRSRYITDLGQSKALGVQNIANMSLDLIDNDQIFIQAPDQPYLVAAAQAFMQGLYPPYSLNSTRTGPLADATGLLANGTAIDFPLNGYQYPNIQALSELDPQSIYIDGTTSCPNSQLSSASYEVTQEFFDTQAAEQSFYQSLDKSWFDADFNFDLDYRYAWEIWDVISYAYNHDSDALEKLSNDSTYAGVYDRLRVLANTDAWYRYGNTSSGGGDPQAMAGKTLAARILGMFQKIVANSGNTTDSESYPLTVLFGEDEPFVSFFSIAMVDAYSANFHARPAPGSAMMFELFTMQRDATFPADHDDLKIRFWYHNATEGYGNDGPTAFSLFGNGPSHMDMEWSEFQDMMSRVMVNQLSDWCDTCSSGSLFCWGVDDSTVQITLAGREKHKLSPVVAGVIGAIVTLVIASLLFAVAMLLGGIRFHRVNRGKKSELGGFKGSAKLASDADLSLPKNGVAPAGIVSFGKDGDKKVTHERVGSWELRQKEFGPKAGDIGDESRRESFEAIETAMGRPVEPTERV